MMPMLKGFIRAVVSRDKSNSMLDGWSEVAERNMFPFFSSAPLESGSVYQFIRRFLAAASYDLRHAYLSDGGITEFSLSSVKCLGLACQFSKEARDLGLDISDVVVKNIFERELKRRNLPGLDRIVEYYEKHNLMAE
jgi:hypothetical protein